MRIVVDPDLCTGQAVCESMAASLIRVNDDGLAEPLVSVVPADQVNAARDVVACCPNRALELAP